MDSDVNLKSEMFHSSSEKSAPKLWAFASGKGGVGKTFLATSFGISLSKIGKKVVIIDLDMHGANVHTSLGQNPAAENIRFYFEGSKSLSELTTKSLFLNLSFIQGFWDNWNPVELSLSQVEKLLEDCKRLDADYVIFDMGSGATPPHLKVFQNVDERFLVTTPEPTSIEKTYRFIEGVICNQLKSDSTPEAYSKLINTLRNHRYGSETHPFSFRNYLKNESGISYDFHEQISANPIRLLINSCRTNNNINLGHSIKLVGSKYYDINIDYTASFDFDNAVWQSVKSKDHVLMAQPFTPLAGQFLTTCKQLIDNEELRAVV